MLLSPCVLKELLTYPKIESIGGLATLEYVDLKHRDMRSDKLKAKDPGKVILSVIATYRLVIWEPYPVGSGLCSTSGQPGNKSIRDVKEQEFTLFPYSAYLDPRTELFVRAWKGVAAAALSENTQEMDTRMPGDFYDGTPLKLKKANTIFDFAKALCTKGRLGHFFNEFPVSDERINAMFPTQGN